MWLFSVIVAMVHAFCTVVYIMVLLSLGTLLLSCCSELLNRYGARHRAPLDRQADTQTEI